MPAKSLTFDTATVGEWVCSRTGGTLDPTSSAAIGLQDASGLIAGVLFDMYNGRSVCMHVAADRAGWLDRDYLSVCFDYPFNQLKVNKILGLVDSTNMRARKFDEHLGFKLESVIKSAGKFEDLLIYSMTRQQCRYLKEMGAKHGRQIGSTTTT